MKYICFILFALLVGCGTSDSQLANQGKSPSYIQGFHDGRHSGMSEQGNAWEHYIRDQVSYQSDANYRSGWLAGEVEGKRLQSQATAIGNSAAGAYSYESLHKEVKHQTDFDKIAHDVTQSADTESLKNLQ